MLCTSCRPRPQLCMASFVNFEHLQTEHLQMAAWPGCSGERIDRLADELPTFLKEAVSRGENDEGKVEGNVSVTHEEPPSTQPGHPGLAAVRLEFLLRAARRASRSHATLSGTREVREP
mmetsp:Transcript_155144/g.497513  ORF Transcript_155144/g.497513 Transcript_155144/m.497513 type:complete len:119 (+) Transcript_155144:285-641(+)